MKPLHIVIIAAIVVVCLALIVLVLVLSKKNKKRIKIDDEFISKLLNALGGINNIEQINVDNGRLKFQVLDLELAKLDDCKSLSTAGVFITGNNIKMLFTYDALDIQKAINRMRKGE